MRERRPSRRDAHGEAGTHRPAAAFWKAFSTRFVPLRPSVCPKRTKPNRPRSDSFVLELDAVEGEATASSPWSCRSKPL